MSFILFITVSACILPGATAQFQGDKIQYATFVYTNNVSSALSESVVLKDTESWKRIDVPEDVYNPADYTLLSVGNDVDREFWIILVNEDGKFFYYVNTYEEWISFKEMKGVCFKFPYQTNILSGVRYVANNSLTQVPCP